MTRINKAHQNALHGQISVARSPIPVDDRAKPLLPTSVNCDDTPPRMIRDETIGGDTNGYLRLLADLLPSGGVRVNRAATFTLAEISKHTLPMPRIQNASSVYSTAAALLINAVRRHVYCTQRTNHGAQGRKFIKLHSPSPSIHRARSAMASHARNAGAQEAPRQIFAGTR